VSAGHYRDMTDEQRLAWGHLESEARIKDLADTRTEAALKAAQDNAAARRKLIGASRGQASDMVIRASRAKRMGAAS
jgi:hypothetical protein